MQRRKRYQNHKQHIQGLSGARDKGAYSGQVDGRAEKERAIVVVSTRCSSWPPCPCPCLPIWELGRCHCIPQMSQRANPLIHHAPPLLFTCTRCPLAALHRLVSNLSPLLLQTHASALCNTAAQDSARQTCFTVPWARCHSLAATKTPTDPRLTLLQRRTAHPSSTSPAPVCLLGPVHAVQKEPLAVAGPPVFPLQCLKWSSVLPMLPLAAARSPPKPDLISTHPGLAYRASTPAGRHPSDLYAGRPIWLSLTLNFFGHCFCSCRNTSPTSFVLSSIASTLSATSLFVCFADCHLCRYP